MKHIGVISRGIKTPIIKTGDDLSKIVVESLINASVEDGFQIDDLDIIAVTEAVVGISQGKYASLDDIASDVQSKFKTRHLGLVFPILSRNRFSSLLRAFARAMDEITIQLSYPKDEVGNSIMMDSDIERLHINPFTDVITYATYQQEMSHFKHPFTGVNMVAYYKEVVESEGCKVNFIFSNQPKEILNYTKEVLVCDIHTRMKTKQAIQKESNLTVLSLDQLMNDKKVFEHANETYGLYGSNAATKEKVKLFPDIKEPIVYDIQQKIFDLTGKKVEVMIYGDGAFKDPVGEIWELADPVVSPSYTKGLEGSPNELKLKYISDDLFKDLRGDALRQAVIDEVRKKSNQATDDSKLGTTPRRYVDLIGSLCDLMSGSGDRGTPVVYIKNYFKNIADES